MPILDSHGNPVVSQTRFANAANRGDRSMPPEPLFKDDFDKLVPDWDRQAIVSGSRKMFTNFPPAKGVITQKANNVVGRAWSPVFDGQDKDWGRLATDWLMGQWYGMCDVRGPAFDFKTLLWLDSVALDRDGDYLIVFSEGEGGYPLTRRVPANRIGQRNGFDSVVSEGPYKGRKIAHGVIFGEHRRPLAYRILGDTAAEDVDVSASDCIHALDPLWHDQSRGMPTLSGSLNFIRSSLRSHEWEQMAQLMMSQLALVEYNETGGPDYDDPSNSLTTLSTSADGSPDLQSPTVETLHGGSIRYFRSNSGGKIETVDQSRPGEVWENFQDRVIRIMCADADWPYELGWKPADANAALVRNIQERARMAVEDRQDVIGGPALRVIRWALAKAMKAGILPYPKTQSDWWRWHFSMPAKFSVDKGRDAQQRREDYKMGFVNRADVIAESGGNIEDVDTARIKEIFDREVKIRAAEEAYGIQMDRRLFYMMGPNDMAQEPADDGEETPKPKPKDEPSQD
jgi:capsid protein